MTCTTTTWRNKYPEQEKIQKKRHKVRKRLRNRGFLPPVGIPMTEDDQKIYDQIGNDDYTFWDEIKLKSHNSQYVRGPYEKIILPPEQRILIRAKENAYRGKYECNLGAEDIFIPKTCPYLGVSIVTDIDKCFDDNYFSIDRIDSSKGYVKGNVQVISNLANTMKNRATKEELIIFAENVLRMA